MISSLFLLSFLHIFRQISFLVSICGPWGDSLTLSEFSELIYYRHQRVGDQSQISVKMRQKDNFEQDPAKTTLKAIGGSGVIFVSESYFKVLNPTEWTLFTEFRYLILSWKYLRSKLRPILTLYRKMRGQKVPKSNFKVAYKLQK